MYLLSRIKSDAPEVLVAFLIFSLSTGVVGGVVVYLDSIGPDVLSEMSQNVIVDMQVHFRSSFYDQNTTTIESDRDLVLEQPYVSAAECVSFIEINDPSVETPEYARSAILGIDSTFATNFPKAINIFEVNDALNTSNCYVQKARLIKEGLTIGGNFTVSVPIDGGWLRRNFTIAGTFDSNLFMLRLSSDTPSFSYLYVVLSRDTLLNDFSNLEHKTENGLVDRIWVGFDTKQLLLEEPSSIVPLLRSIEKQLEQRILPDATVVDFVLIGVFYEYSMWATSMRVIALAFSVPSIIMAVMLIQYNSKLESEQQRRNVGALKTRGASSRQAVFWILTLSLFTGLIGSLGAILTGVFSATLAGGVRELMLFSFSKMSSFAIILQPQSLTLIFLFSFIAGLLMAIPAAIKAFLMSPAEAHSVVKREDIAQEGGLSNPAYQFGAVAISGIILLLLIGGLQSFTDLSTGSAATGIMLLVFLAIFILGLTLLLARPAAKMKSMILLRIRKRSISAVCKVLGRNALAYSRSEALAMVFISLVFTAGVFSSVSATTGNQHMKELFMFNVGADIVMDVRHGYTNVTLDLLSEILTVEGVSHASGMVRTSARVTYRMDWNGHIIPYNRTTLVYGVQPKEFSESAFLRPEFGYYGDPRTTIPLLAESEQYAVANFKPIVEYTSDAYGNSYPVLSDNIGMELMGPEGKHTMNCTIINVLGSSPSLAAPDIYGGLSFRGISYMPGENVIGQFIMLDIHTVQEYLNISYVNRFYVSITPEANYTQVMQKLGRVAPGSFEEISSPYTQINAILDSRAGESIYGAYTLNIIFSILYLTAGITLVMTMKIRGLRRNLSVLRALGEQPRLILWAVLIDSVIGIALGAIVGGAIGLILSYLILRIPLTYLGFSTQVSWDRLPLVISVPTFLIIGLLTLAFVFSTAISYIIIHNALKSNIAGDIQHSE